jgi:predicted transcriptional regulator of viral defense system
MKIHKKLNPLLVQKELKEKGLLVFTPKEFERVFDVSSTAVSQFIHAYIEKKFFSKLRNGLYSLEGERPNLYFAANKIYRPSYISLETALSYYGIIPETVYSITSITSKPTRNFDALGVDFSYTRIKQKAFQGYTARKEGESTVLFAEPEKAFADYLYFVSLGKKTLNDRFYLKNLDMKKVRQYIELYDRPGVARALESALALPEQKIY